MASDQQTKRPDYGIVLATHGLYYHNEISLGDIAKRYSVWPGTVAAWFRRYGLPMKPHGWHRKGKPSLFRGKKLGPYATKKTLRIGEAS